MKIFWRASLLLLTIGCGVVLGQNIYVKYYKASFRFRNLPDFSTQTSYKEEFVSDINYPITRGNFAGSGRRDYVAAVFEGFLLFPVEGQWELFITSDDGSKLYIGDPLANSLPDALIDNDGVHGSAERSGNLVISDNFSDTCLEVRVEYFERRGRASLQVKWEGPGVTKEIIPASAWLKACPTNQPSDRPSLMPTDQPTALPSGSPTNSTWLGQNIFVEYYAGGNITKMPDFSTLTPYKKEFVSDINYEDTSGEFAGSETNNNVAAVFKAFLLFPVEGLWELFLESDDGSKLYIIDPLTDPLIDNDGIHGMVEKSKKLFISDDDSDTCLKVQVDYFIVAAGGGLRVWWEGPGVAKQPIPASAWLKACPA